MTAEIIATEVVVLDVAGLEGKGIEVRAKDSLVWFAGLFNRARVPQNHTRKR